MDIIDITKELGAVVREVRPCERDGKPARTVVATRVYGTDIDDAWDALTNAERIPRWFLPITGELRVGGRYQLEGNAGGEIVACDPPRHLSVTWEFGGRMSWLEIALTVESAERTRLELAHTVPVDEHWEKFGAGAVGLGWELALAGLGRHLAGLALPDHAKAEESLRSPSGKSVLAASSEEWARAAIAAGEKEADARASAQRTTAFYTGTEST